MIAWHCHFFSWALFIFVFKAKAKTALGHLDDTLQGSAEFKNGTDGYAGRRSNIAMKTLAVICFSNLKLLSTVPIC